MLITLNGSTSADVLQYVTVAAQSSGLVTAALVLNPGDVLRAHATAATAIALTGFGSLLDGAPE